MSRLSERFVKSITKYYYEIRTVCENNTIFFIFRKSVYLFISNKCDLGRQVFRLRQQKIRRYVLCTYLLTMATKKQRGTASVYNGEQNREPSFIVGVELLGMSIFQMENCCSSLLVFEDTYYTARAPVMKSTGSLELNSRC